MKLNGFLMSKDVVVAEIKENDLTILNEQLFVIEHRLKNNDINSSQSYK